MKKNKYSKKNKKIVWGFFGLIVFIALLLILALGNLPKKVQNQQVQKISPTLQMESNRYHSEILNITFDMPDGLSIKEENVLRELILEKNGDTIKIHRFGTNRSYNNITELLDDSYQSSNIFKPINRQKININNNDCEIVDEVFSNQPEQNNRSYYCLRNSNSFLSFSTTSPELYFDLDQIARSFRYEP